MDSLIFLDLKTDSTLLLMKESFKRGNVIFFYEPKNLSLINGSVVAFGYYFCPVSYKLSRKKFLNLLSANIILIRQNFQRYPLFRWVFNPPVPDVLNWRISAFEKRLHDTETSYNVAGSDQISGVHFSISKSHQPETIFWREIFIEETKPFCVFSVTYNLEKISRNTFLLRIKFPSFEA